MIHYRTINKETSLITKPTRSLSVARRQCLNGSKIYAFESRKAALALSQDCLEIAYDQGEPKLLTADNLLTFVQSHHEAKAVHPKYPPTSASSRRQMEHRFNNTLFGFTQSGVAINARQYCDVSCKWVYYSCPIFISSKKATIRALEKELEKEDN